MTKHNVTYYNGARVPVNEVRLRYYVMTGPTITNTAVGTQTRPPYQDGMLACSRCCSGQ